jgi:hypothetical protein
VLPSPPPYPETPGQRYPASNRHGGGRSAPSGLPARENVSKHEPRVNTYGIKICSNQRWIRNYPAVYTTGSDKTREGRVQHRTAMYRRQGVPLRHQGKGSEPQVENTCIDGSEKRELPSRRFPATKKRSLRAQPCEPYNAASVQPCLLGVAVPQRCRRSPSPRPNSSLFRVCYYKSS